MCCLFEHGRWDEFKYPSCVRVKGYGAWVFSTFSTLYSQSIPLCKTFLSLPRVFIPFLYAYHHGRSGFWVLHVVSVFMGRISMSLELRVLMLGYLCRSTSTSHDNLYSHCLFQFYNKCLVEEYWYLLSDMQGSLLFSDELLSDWNLCVCVCVWFWLLFSRLIRAKLYFSTSNWNSHSFFCHYFIQVTHYTIWIHLYDWTRVW